MAKEEHAELPQSLIPVARLAYERTGRRPSPSTISRWVKSGTRGGKLSATKIYSQWRCTRADFEDFLWRRSAVAMQSASTSNVEQQPIDATLKAETLL